MKNFKVVTFTCVLSVLAGCQAHVNSAPAEQAVVAQTFVVQAMSRNETVNVAGVVKPHLEADLAAQMVAPVGQVMKREGDHVRKGEVLVRLHAPALEAGVAQSNAALSSAEKQERAATAQASLADATLGRYLQLQERRSVTPYELDQIKAQDATARAQQQSASAQVMAARSGLAMQRANAADANLYAPFDGVVTRRLVDPGAMAAPGVPLLHLQSTGDADVEFAVPETLLSSLRVGTAVGVSLGGDGSVDAKVATIGPAGDAGSHSFLVKATLPRGAGWNAGTVVQVALPSQGVTTGVEIPSRAVIQQGGLDAVLAVGADGRAGVRYITLGNTAGGMSEVLTGVRAGDRVVADGNLGLAGRKIEVQP